MKAAAQVFVRVHATARLALKARAHALFGKKEGNAFWRDLKGALEEFLEERGVTAYGESTAYCFRSLSTRVEGNY
jgi:hypothetical protein